MNQTNLLLSGAICLLISATACQKTNDGPTASASESSYQKTVLMKTNYGLMVDSRYYAQLKEHNPEKDPLPQGPILAYSWKACTTKDGRAGAICTKSTKPNCAIEPDYEGTCLPIAGQ